MTETRIHCRLSVPIEVFREEDVYVARCESLQVHSQGATWDEARLLKLTSSVYRPGRRIRDRLAAQCVFGASGKSPSTGANPIDPSPIFTGA